MSHSAAPSQGKENYGTVYTLWEQDPTLQQRLYAIVADAAEAGNGARLVVVAPWDRPRVLLGVRGGRHPWRVSALAVLEHGDAISCDGTTAAPFYGPSGLRELRGALLLYHDLAHPLRGGEEVARAHSARIELALALSSSHLVATQSAVDALHQALAAHDERTAYHSIVVRQLTATLGRALGVAPPTLLEWEWAALLHDIGKISVPPSLLHKPGALDPADWAVIRQHPSVGERIVRAIPALHDVGLVVRHHHERWDGQGYPDRLSGHAIPLAARVVALVDAYETMCTGRPYHAPVERAEALDELRRAMGTQFDPELLSLLLVLRDLDLT